MIKKYKGYDEVQVGEFRALKPGGYVLTIKDAKISESKSGKEMLVISYDIAEGEYEGYYTDMYRNSDRADKKWGGVHYIVLPDERDEGSTSYKWALKRLKGLETAVNNSNTTKWNMDERALKGRLVGALIRREQYENRDGELRFSTKIATFVSADTIRSGKFEIPADKLLEEKVQPKKEDEFVAIMGDDSDSDLPF